MGGIPDHTGQAFGLLPGHLDERGASLVIQDDAVVDDGGEPELEVAAGMGMKVVHHKLDLRGEARILIDLLDHPILKLGLVLLGEDRAMLPLHLRQGAEGVV